MIILAIETSCDESAISIVEAKGGLTKPAFSTIVHLVSSQIELHREFGGVVPNLAKREHGKNLVPLLLEALEKSKLLVSPKTVLKSLQGRSLNSRNQKLEKILEREPELKIAFFEKIINIPAPKIDAIAVTAGPGLEPALWVGINLARALGLLWDIPVVPTNHIEGHLISPLLNKKTNPIEYSAHSAKKSLPKSKRFLFDRVKIAFPAIGTIISGGHTEIILIKKWRDYQYLGRTRDDAVGEAFDKVARLLDLPYPGGPEISKIADSCRLNADQRGRIQRQSASSLRESAIKLPRPMLHSGDFDFSFSGLKTAVLYLIKRLGTITDEQKASIAKEFEDSAAEVVVTKTMSAAKKYKAKTIIVGGGVIANRAIRTAFAEAITRSTDSGQAKINLILPDQNLTGDNATMIAGAGYLTLASKAGSTSSGRTKLPSLNKIVANGNLKLGE